MYDQELIGQLVSKDNYYRDPAEVRALRHKAVAMAHKHHYHNNKFYHELCKTKDIGEDVDPSTFHLLLFPDNVFKSYEVENPEREPEKFHQWVRTLTSHDLSFTPQKGKSLEALLEQYNQNGLFLGFSSGTSGKLTFLPRDQFTQSMIARSYVEAVDSTVTLNKGKDYFILGIPSRTFLQVGFNGRTVATTLSPDRVTFGMDHLASDVVRLRMRGPRSLKEKVKNKAIQYMGPKVERRVVRTLVTALQEHKHDRVVFLAPPFLLVESARYVIEQGLDLKVTEESFLASTGGFKGRAVTSREAMNKLLSEAFGISESQYLDLYGMTESNSIMVECTEENNKHVPPWMELVLLGENMEPLEQSGVVTGRYAFLEPSSRSFPAFITTGDEITVDFDGCSCGKKTPIVTKIGRAMSVEDRGCSGVLSKTVGG